MALNTTWEIVSNDDTIFQITSNDNINELFKVAIPIAEASVSSKQAYLKYLRNKVQGVH